MEPKHVLQSVANESLLVYGYQNGHPPEDIWLRDKPAVSMYFRFELVVSYQNSSLKIQVSRNLNYIRHNPLLYHFLCADKDLSPQTFQVSFMWSVFLSHITGIQHQQGETSIKFTHINFARKRITFLSIKGKFHKPKEDYNRDRIKGIP